jgi:hypothetical protein
LRFSALLTQSSVLSPQSFLFIGIFGQAKENSLKKDEKRKLPTSKPDLETSVFPLKKASLPSFNKAGLLLSER